MALLPWGNVIEDFLEAIDISLEEFCTSMTGGWLFGYIEALQLEDVATTVFCFSAGVDGVTRVAHPSTGATICLLPAPVGYRTLRRMVVRPQGSPTPATASRRLAHRVGDALQNAAGYLATPPWLLERELRRERCTAILCQEYENPRFDVCVAVGKRLRLPVYATFQGGNWQASLLEGPVRPLALRGCEGLIIGPRTESERVQTQYGIPAEKISRIFNPLDLSTWQAQDRLQARAALNIPSEARVVAWHGRIDMHRKGLDVLLKAWAMLCSGRQRRGENLQLLVVGTGADADAFGQMISDLRLQGVRWINQYLLDRELMCRYLSAADAYVFSSRHEGFPVAPVEAMACGLPVVASNAPGIPDILEGGEQAGGIVVPTDDPAALATALKGLLTDLSRSRALGINARHRAEASFSLSAVGQQLRTALFGSDRSSVRANAAVTAPAVNG